MINITGRREGPRDGERRITARHALQPDDDGSADSLAWSYAARKRGRNPNGGRGAQRFVDRIAAQEQPAPRPLERLLAAAPIAEDTMEIDPQLNAERQAARKLRKLEQRYPLLHHTGILEQVAERWTAERHLALQAACRESLAASMNAAHAQAFASTELYMEVCCELTGEGQMRAWTLRCNTAGFPKRPEYIADFWYQSMKEVLGLSQPCSCGGIWVRGLHQPRRRGEATHILDWYCAGCGAAAMLGGEPRSA